MRFLRESVMPKTGMAKLFANGQSQAVRLPKEFRFEGEAVRVRRVPGGVLLQPIRMSALEWFQQLDERAAAGAAAGRKRRRRRRAVRRSA